MKSLITSRLALALIALVIIIAGILGILSRPQDIRAATGDWPTFLFSNARTGFNGSETIINRTTAPNLKIHWTHTTGALITAQPVEANGMVYWGSWDGVEHGSRLSDGTDVWTANLGTTTDSCAIGSDGVTSTATIATEQIGGVATPVDFVGGGGNATFYALNANTGAVIWQRVLSSQPDSYIWSSPAIYNGSVYIGLSSLNDCPLVQGQVLRLNAVTGVIQNTFDIVPAGCTGGSVWSSPTIDTTLGRVYVSTGNEGTCSTTETMTDAIIALSTTNLSLVASWQVPLAQEITDGDFGATPTLFKATIGGTSHQMVGLINKNGTYYALDRTNISAGPLWQVQMAEGANTPGVNNLSSSAWDGKSLYVATGGTTINGKSCKGSLQALNPTSGASIWQDCLSQNPMDPVIAVPGLAELGYGPFFILVNSSTGKTLFTFHDTNTHSNFFGPASISNGVLYQGNNDGILYAFGT